MVSSETSTVSPMTVLTDRREAGAPKVSHAPAHQQMMAKKGSLSFHGRETEAASTQPLSAVKSVGTWVAATAGAVVHRREQPRSVSVRGMRVGQVCG